jgi:hypothetical protein
MNANNILKRNEPLIFILRYYSSIYLKKPQSAYPVYVPRTTLRPSGVQRRSAIHSTATSVQDMNKFVSLMVTFGNRIAESV